MKYILANNATATLSASITDSETSLVLADISATLATALGQVDANNRILLTLTDIADAVHEIVEVTAWNSGTSTATITRAQDGTTAAEWAAGSKAEVRVGRLQLRSVNYGEGIHAILIDTIPFMAGPGSALGNYSIGVGMECEADGLESIAIGRQARAYGDRCICIGKTAEMQTEWALVDPTEYSILIGTNTDWAEGARSVLLGHDIFNEGHDSVVLGSSAYNKGDECVVIGRSAKTFGNNKAIIIGNSTAHSPAQDIILIGNGAETGNDHAISIGSGNAYGDYAIAIGKDGMASGPGCISIGRESKAYIDKDISIGHSAEAGGEMSIAIGGGAQAWGKFSTAVGFAAFAGSNLFAHLAMLPVLNKTVSLPTLETGDIATRHRAAPSMTLASGIIDLTDGTSTAQIELPAGTHFFPDRIDVIITGVDTPGGSPEITVGTTAAGTDILAATVITKNAAQQRQKISPDADDGVDGIHISVSTAGSGTTYNCRVIVSGYLVEDE